MFTVLSNRIYRHLLRGLLALILAAAAASAVVIVNTEVLVQGEFDLAPSNVARR